MADGFDRGGKYVNTILATLNEVDVNSNEVTDLNRLLVFKKDEFKDDQAPTILLKLLFKICNSRDPTLGLFFAAARYLVQKGDLPSKGVNRYLKEQIDQETHEMDISFYKTYFEELRELGRGSFGAVYLARHKLDKRFYAVKKVEFISKPGQDYRKKKVFQEVKFLSQIDSPHIVRYYGAWVEHKGMKHSNSSPDFRKRRSENLMKDSLSDLFPDYSAQPVQSTVIPRRQVEIGEHALMHNFSPYASIREPTPDPPRASTPSFHNFSPYASIREPTPEPPRASTPSFQPPYITQQMSLHSNPSPIISGAFDDTGGFSPIVSPMGSLLEIQPSLMDSNPYPVASHSLRDMMYNHNDNLQDVELTPMGSLVSLGHQEEEIFEVDFSYLQEPESRPISKANSLPDFLNLQNIYVKIELFLQMEFAGLWSLKDFIRHPNRVVRKSDICIIVTQILKGLIDIHSHGLIHRDLKPENVFVDRKSKPYSYSEEDELTPDPSKEVALYQSTNPNPDIPDMFMPCLNVNEWQLKIGDFGISKLDIDTDENVPSSALAHNLATPSGSSCGIGTWPYGSPEQLGENSLEQARAADLFSVGVIMFELMVPAYSTDHERTVVLEALRRGIVPPAIIQEFPELSQVLQSLLAHNPEDRPTAEEALSLVRECESFEFNDLMKNSKEWLAEEVIRLRKRIGGCHRGKKKKLEEKARNKEATSSVQSTAI